MVRKNTLKIDHDGIVVNADVRLEKLEGRSFEQRHEIVYREAESGERLERELYDTATGETLEEGYGYRWVTDDGRVVDRDDVEIYEKVDGREEREVRRHEPTLGRERTLEPEEWVPLGRMSEYLVTRTYEMWAEDAPDVRQLYDLAKSIRTRGEAPVLPVVLNRTIYRSWGVVTPQFYADDFSMIVQVTRERVDPEHRMPRPETAEVEVEESEVPTIEQEPPFGD